MRGQGGGKSLPTGYLPLHGDDTSPQPHPNYHNLCTVNICLTDLTEESGCLAFVPGSHKRLRQPSPGESIVAGEGANPEIVPVVAPRRLCGDLACAYVARVLGVKNTWFKGHPGRAFCASTYPALRDVPRNRDR